MKSKPENNAANLELLKNLSKIFNSSVKILKGFKSRNKTVAVEGGAESLQAVTEGGMDKILTEELRRQLKREDEQKGSIILISNFSS